MKDKYSKDRIEMLSPYREVKKIFTDFIEECENTLGITLRIAMPVFRSSEEEDALFKEGKSKARGGQSYHNYGLAIDLCELTPDLKGIATWDMSKLVPTAQKYKLEWGGSWKSFKDKPHFELRFEFKENCSDLILLPKDAHGYAILPPLAV